MDKIKFLTALKTQEMLLDNIWKQELFCEKVIYRYVIFHRSTDDGEGKKLLPMQVFSFFPPKIGFDSRDKNCLFESLEDDGRRFC
ncbi:MAG: hypothetical protein US82_C0032G0009 [Parcubacteria group bacterium GW2011_GWC1_38_22]|nr:MAG: hypothetical protein US82_C0032G0009 [Parcubacteria group bacterium GW2011_GWC1_38_22]